MAAESKLVGRQREISKTLAPRGRQLDGEGLRALALALAGHFGSLEAAWRQFDLNQTGLVSRYQWDAALDRLPFGMQDVCGMPGGRVFLQLSQAGEVTAEGWRRFFSDFAESAEGSQALAQAAERVAARRRTTPAGQASAAAAEARGAAAPARPERRSLPDRSPWSAADVLEREALLSREELAEVELQAKAEKDVLQDELKELNLSGLQALVYIITAKLGTLDRAAGWFDLSKTGKVSHNEFDVGNRVMRIDPKELTGFNTSEIYRMMDTTSTGMVPAREFQAFLDKILEEMKESGLGDALAKAAGLAQRAKSRRRLSEKLPPPREPPRRTSTAAPEPQTPAVVEEVKNIGGHEFHGCEKPAPAPTLLAVPQGPPSPSPAAALQLDGDEASFRDKMRRELSKLAQGAVVEYSLDNVPQFDGRKLRIVEELAGELGLFCHRLELVGDSRPNPWQHTPSTSQFRSHSSEAIIVFNLLKFATRVRQQLKDIDEGGSHVFPADLSIPQRQVVHVVAASLGLWARSEGKGAERRVIAFNAGQLAVQIRERLEALGPGETAEFPCSYTEVQRKIVHLIASELVLWSYSEGAGEGRHVQVFNMSEFAHRVRGELEYMEAGDSHAYPSSLTEKERKVVHCIAQELGLDSLSQGDSGDRFVTVEHLRVFRKKVRHQLEALPAGASRDFSPTLSAVQRKAVHEIAAELGLSSVSNGRGPQRYVSVAREDVESPSPIPFAVGKQASPDPAESDDEGSAEGLEPGIPALFREHASGSYGGGPIFMRAGDMDAFLQELEEALPSRGRRAKNPRAVVNSCYEDVIQLQLDFGVKTRQGLTKQWFQVFVQKAAASLGMSCMGMLLAMGHGDA